MRTSNYSKYVYTNYFTENRNESSRLLLRSILNYLTALTDKNTLSFTYLFKADRLLLSFPLCLFNWNSHFL